MYTIIRTVKFSMALRLRRCKVAWIVPMELPALIAHPSAAIAGSVSFVELRLRLFQVGGIKSLGKRAVDRREKIAGLLPFELIKPQTPQAHRGAQFLGLGAHLSRQGDRAAKIGFGQFRRALPVANFAAHP